MSRWNVGKLTKDRDGEEPPTWNRGAGVIVETREDAKKFAKEFHFKEEYLFIEDSTVFPITFSLSGVLDVTTSKISPQYQDIRGHDKMVIEIIGFIEGDEDE